MFSFFRKKVSEIAFPTVDIHSHLLPGIDDGVQTIEESLEVISAFSSLGYTKLITTPHIMSDLYPNTPTIIKNKLEEVKVAVRNAEIPIEIEAAAEYYLDEGFINLIDQRSELLTFGDNYLLFETGFTAEPFRLKEVIFNMVTQGYKPVLAHPERYLYYHGKTDELRDLVDRGVLLQVNMNSLVGYYSKEVRKVSQQLMERGMVSFIGSDCHNMKHLAVLKSVASEKLYKKIVELPLLNSTL